MTSQTPDLDTTIDLMNTMLESAKDQKQKLAIMDRLLRAYALKYKFTSGGKGGKFSVLNNASDSTHA